MNDKQIFAIDFGSENIRLARSTQNIYAPQVLRPNLLNAVRVDRIQGVTAIGNSVYDDVQTGSLILGVNIFDEKLGPGGSLALVSLLQEAHKMMEIDRLSSEEKLKYETIFSMPLGNSYNDSKIAVARLLENGFPSPRAMLATGAIFLNYFPDQKFQLGDYLIVDCGALQTRMALCRVDSSNNFSKIVEDVSGTTGGNEIDRLLMEHFLEILNDPQVNRAELLNFTRKFKKGFLNKILQGSIKYLSRSPFLTGVPTFDLNLEDFQKLSHPYFEAFEKSILGFLEHQKVVPANLKGLLLAGGNSQWPFIINFTESLVEKNNVVVNEFPEDAIVRGLSLTMLESQPTGNSIKEKIKENQSTPKIVIKRPPQISVKKEAHSFPLWLAILLEFFPGLFGILGIGWGVGTGTVFSLPVQWSWKSLFLRIPLLLVWPFILIVFAVLLVGMSFQFSDWKILIIFIPFWCGVPLASAFLAFWSSKKVKRGKDV